MIKFEAIRPAAPSDAELVTGSLGGNRHAFRQIVERYKTLICSVAYCGTGNVSQSEDLAQETFVAAWGNLRLLREPAKLRGWLCGIARHRTQKYWHQEGRELTHNASPLEAASTALSTEDLPSDQAVTRDEEAIMWQSLSKIPDIYREPLVLYYREHRSVGQVAMALELTEDAVKQRLSRGRKLLQEEVQAFVERALQRTAPKSKFTDAVFGALPLVTAPAATSAAWSLSAKGTALTKAGFGAAWLAPVVGTLGGFCAQWLVIREITSDARTRSSQLKRLFVSWLAIVGIAVAGEWSVELLARYLAWNDRSTFAITAVFWWVYGCGLIVWVIASVQRVTALVEQRKPVVETLPPAMKPWTYAAMVVGGYLSLGSWLIGLAWRAHDQLAVNLTAGSLLLLGLALLARVSKPRSRRRSDQFASHRVSRGRGAVDFQPAFRRLACCGSWGEFGRNE